MAALSQIFPLLVLLVVLGLAAFVGYAAYCVVNDVADKTSKKMEEKNVSFSKDGMRVGIKEKKTENYVDQTQSLLVKAWNFSTWPAYKSRLWNKEQPVEQKPQPRRSYSNGAGPS